MNDSNIFGVSLRGIAALVIILSCCVLALQLKDIVTLKDMGLVALGYLFGRAVLNQTGGNSNGENISKTN